MFIIAFMGAGLLFPSYFLQVRGETTLAAGLLIAPQGIGAMLTMPIAGMLADACRSAGRCRSRSCSSRPGSSPSPSSAPTRRTGCSAARCS
ncbi:hypothetical protein QTS76_36875 [Micromonospora sp. b486]|nr:hypothetical protein [Micromonospora sp. b486]MDM4784629.1 hypothetical protein [Micromonospora sp. b486]